MSSLSTPAALPNFIEEMLAKRQSHVDAIGVIDATLSRVSTALGVADVTATIAKPVAVKPVGAAKAVVAKPAAKPVAVKAAPAAKRGKASKFGLSANEFVLAHVGSAKSATTKEVNEAWKAAGRSGTADNAMSQLTKLKKLKRSPMPGGARGSKYTLA
jgi:hypothetical protein